MEDNKSTEWWAGYAEAMRNVRENVGNSLDKAVNVLEGKKRMLERINALASKKNITETEAAEYGALMMVYKKYFKRGGQNEV